MFFSVWVGAALPWGVLLSNLSVETASVLLGPVGGDVKCGRFARGDAYITVT